MSKFTPGPWEVVRSATTGPMAKNWREIRAGHHAVVRPDYFTKTIMSTGEAEHHSGVWMTAEDADLIAAAPDLYEVVRRAVDCNALSEDTHLGQAAREALAKAVSA